MRKSFLSLLLDFEEVTLSLVLDFEYFERIEYSPGYCNRAVGARQNQKGEEREKGSNDTISAFSREREREVQERGKEEGEEESTKREKGV